MQTVTRRKALTIVAAAPAAVAMGAGEAVATENIYALIDAHKAAHKRVYRTVLQAKKADARFRKEWHVNPVLAPAAITPSGDQIYAHWDTKLNNREQIMGGINEHYEREMAGCRWMRGVIPDQAKVAEAALQDMKARAIAYIDEAEAETARREEAAGLTKALDAYHDAADAEVEARARLILCQPKTTAGGKAKANYLSKCDPLQEEWGSEEFVGAIIRLSAEVAS